MKYNKITVIKTIKKELFFSVFGLFVFIVFEIIIKKYIIFIIPFFIYYIIIILKIFFLKDFILLEDGFSIIGINNELKYKNIDIKNISIKIPMRTMSYWIYINEKKYYINISDKNKNSLINYFEKTNYNGKESFLNIIRKKTVYY
jgi:hypothetical protein